MGERSKTTPASNCREHKVPAPSGHGHSPPEGSEHWSGAPSFPAGLPAQGVCGLPRERQAEMCGGGDASYPREEGRGGKRTPGKSGRESTPPCGSLCSPRVTAPALLLANGPSASRCSPARLDTRHLWQRRAPALGWLAAGLVSHRGRLKKIKERSPPLPSWVEKKRPD